MASTAKDVLSAKSEITQQKLIDAGIELFAKQGFEATSTRQVQDHAQVQRNLITYHFGSKERFWKACMHELFGRRMNQVMGPAIEQAKDIATTERIRFLVRRFIRASAANPESTSIMFDEGRSDNWRLEWLVSRYVQPFYGVVESLYEKDELGGSWLTVVQFYYLLVSSASVFAMAPELRRLSGTDPFDEAFVDNQANTIAQLLTPSRPLQET